MRGHQALHAEQKLSLADKWAFEPQKWRPRRQTLSRAQHLWITGWIPSFQPYEEGSGDRRGLMVGMGDVELPGVGTRAAGASSRL